MQIALLQACKLCALTDAAALTAELTQLQLLQLASHLLPGIAGGALGDPDQQQGQPTYQDMSADAFF